MTATLPLPILCPAYNPAVTFLAKTSGTTYAEVKARIDSDLVLQLVGAGYIARKAAQLEIEPARYLTAHAFGHVLAMVHAKALVEATASGLVDRTALAEATARQWVAHFAGLDMAAELACYTPNQLIKLWQGEVDMAQIHCDVTRELSEAV